MPPIRVRSSVESGGGAAGGQIIGVFDARSRDPSVVRGVVVFGTCRIAAGAGRWILRLVVSFGGSATRQGRDVRREPAVRGLDELGRWRAVLGLEANRPSREGCEECDRAVADAATLSLLETLLLFSAVASLRGDMSREELSDSSREAARDATSDEADERGNEGVSSDPSAANASTLVSTPAWSTGRAAAIGGDGLEDLNSSVIGDARALGPARGAARTNAVSSS